MTAESRAADIDLAAAADTFDAQDRTVGDQRVRQVRSPAEADGAACIRGFVADKLTGVDDVGSDGVQRAASAVDADGLIGMKRAVLNQRRLVPGINGATKARCAVADECAVLDNQFAIQTVT